MGLLRRAAGAALVRGSKAVSKHVLPDNITPWGTRKKLAKTTSWGFGKLTRSTKRKKKAASKPSSRPVRRKEKFDRNAWNQGRALKADTSFGFLGASSSTRSATASPSRPQRSRLRAQLHDLRHHPQLVLQMKYDELAHDVAQLKRKAKDSFSSSFRYRH